MYDHKTGIRSVLTRATGTGWEAAYRQDVGWLLERVGELEATIAAERGIGPVGDGWYWVDGQWNREVAGCLLTVERDSCPIDDDLDSPTPWLPSRWTAHVTTYWNTDSLDDERSVTTKIGAFDYAPEAMRAADATVTP